MTEKEERYPKGNCIAIYPKGEDEIQVYFGHGCEGWQLIAHAGHRFIQLIGPNMKYPITITTQIHQLEDIASYFDGWLVNDIVLRTLPEEIVKDVEKAKRSRIRLEREMGMKG